MSVQFSDGFLTPANVKRRKPRRNLEINGDTYPAAPPCTPVTPRAPPTPFTDKLR